MRIRRAYGVYAAIPIVLSALGAHAAPLAPQKASDVITLAGTSSALECTMGSSAHQIVARQKGDGTTDTFTVPAKNVYVVESFDFIFQSAAPSKNVFVGLFVEDVTLTTSAIVSLVPALADSAGNGGGAVTLPSGFAVKPGVRLCFQVLGAPNGSMNVHGFLAKDK